MITLTRKLKRKRKVKPKWVTPERQEQIVKLFLKGHGFCVHGFYPCNGHFERKVSVLCAHRLPRRFECAEPRKHGELCRFKPLDGKPHLPCQVYADVTLKWRCAYGSYDCPHPFGNHYELAVRRLKKEWSTEARLQKLVEWQAERKALHALNERRTPIRGRFTNISRDIFLSNQPEFYLEGIGISGLTLKPFAKVRLASSYMRLYIDLSNTVRKVSRHAKRKAIRYGKPLPLGIEETIIRAVRHYLKR